MFWTACACQFVLSTAKWLVRIQEQLVPVNSFLLSVKWLVQIQEQFVPMLFVSVISQAASSNTRTACAYLPVSFLGQVPSSSQKNNLYLSIRYFFPQWTLLFAILLMSTNPAMDTTYFVKTQLSVCLAFIIKMLHGIHDIHKCIFTPKISANVDI